jgi:hypothetical protein
METPISTSKSGMVVIAVAQVCVQPWAKKQDYLKIT